jgi:hypothetical protein
MRISSLIVRGALFASALLTAHPATAIVTVGPKTDNLGCTFQSIQKAVDSVLALERSNSPDTDPFIAIAGGRVYNEKVVVDGSGVSDYRNPLGQKGAYVAIFGNFDDHCDGATNTPALISAGGSQSGNSVIRINGFTALSLNDLILANAVVSGNGGGIDFESSGLLDLTRVEITNNQAGYGGGIFAGGHPVGISVTLHEGTWIHGNSAAHAGGGIRIQGETRLFALEPLTLIEHNIVNLNDSISTGGGLNVTGPQAIADIGSPGFNASPVISNNQAGYGGGIAIGDGGTVRLFSSQQSLPARIEFNSATHLGGGIYLNGSDGPGLLCGQGYTISHNSAPNASAIYSYRSMVDFTADGLSCGSTAFVPDHAACTPGFSSCNTIEANESALDANSGDPTSTAIELIGESFSADGIVLRGNIGANVLNSGAGMLTLRNCLFSGNLVEFETIDTSNASLELSFCTLAGNTGAPAISYSSLEPTFLTVQRSIIWQPGAATLSEFAQKPGIQFIDVLTSDAATINHTGFGAFTNVFAADPRFVDPANGNFHLRPESPAVDNAPIGPATDLEGQPRPIDLLHFNGSFAPYDIGAYEVQDHGDVIFSDGCDRIPNT